ncbi:Hpt domain-containing protein [Methylobacterium oryzisoli]|uniref:Hpt domain-containing protein n=1 Tax=Methylobacterium oryzisoli TaxID=3385502 RepID=UPI003891F3B2
MTDPEPLLDRDHLARQTFGDADLAAEVLALFREQCASLLPALADAERPPADRADLAHTLKGAALGIGARRVAAAAAALEAALRADEAGHSARGHPSSADDRVGDLTAAAEATLALL